MTAEGKVPELTLLSSRHLDSHWGGGVPYVRQVCDVKIPSIHAPHRWAGDSKGSVSSSTNMMPRE